MNLPDVEMDDRIYSLSGSDTLDGLDVLPGFRLRIADLFALP